MGLQQFLIILTLLGGLTKHPERAAYKVTISTGQGHYNVGSGAAIGPKIVITNHHVAGGYDGGFIYNEVNFREIPVKVIAYESILDIAILQIMDDTELEFVEISETCPNELSFYGFNGSSRQLVTAKGQVIGALSTRPAKIANFQVVGGNSGSGVYTDDGKFCGIVWGADPNVHFTPIEPILEKFKVWNVQWGSRGCFPGRGNSPMPNPGRPAPIPNDEDEPPSIDEIKKDCKCDPAKLKDLELKIQRTAGDVESTKKELGLVNGRLDNVEKQLREADIERKEQTLILQRLDAKLSGQLKIRFKYDPNTNTLTPIK